MLVIVAPGQGAQAPGFLAPWLDVPGVADRLAHWSGLAGCDLARCGSTADADEIRDTSVAQPLLVAAALAAADATFGGLGQMARSADRPPGTAWASWPREPSPGVLSADDDALRLVQCARMPGRRRPPSRHRHDGGLGGDEAEVLAAIEEHGLTPANVNGAGQIVAAGTMEQLDAFADHPPAAARLRPLQVAGAFHTEHMAMAVDALRGAAENVTVTGPVMTLLSDADGAAVRSGQDWLNRIVNQVSAPVRWDECMRSMAGLGVTALIELPPAGTLTGLARRALPGVDLLALKTPDQIPAARALAAEHGPAQRHDGADHADAHQPGANGHHPEWERAK